MIVKNIGFKENKKCESCDNLAYYQVGNTYFCSRHMEGFIDWREEFTEALEK